MSDLTGNPLDRFSHDEAHMTSLLFAHLEVLSPPFGASTCDVNKGTSQQGHHYENMSVQYEAISKSGKKKKILDVKM